MTASERPAEQRADIDGQGNVTVQIVGDKNRVTVGSAAALRLSMFARKRTELGDMGLLSAFTQSIALVGRESEMAEVRTWLASARDIAIQVWIGSAGAGKTRLAFDLCDQLDKAGAWQAGFVDGDQLAGLITDAGARWGWDRPTLAVVDYAAERADVVRRWFGQLAVFAPTDGPPLRILLLERQADPQKGWLQMALGLGDSQSRTVRAMLDPSDPLLLSRLMSSDHRRAILNEMFERMRLPIRTPSAGSAPYFDRRLQELSWGGEPLFLMMAALLAAEASLPQVLALPRTEIAHKVAEREIGRVHRLAKKQGLDADLLVHMAAYVTLCQGLDRSSLLDAIETEADALKRTMTGGAATVADALADALPGTPSAPEPIRPDAVGEAVLLRALGDPRIDGAAVVIRAFALAGKQVAASVLRTAQDFAAEGHDQPLLWLNALIRQASDDTDMLFNLAGQIPARSIALAEAAAQIYRKIISNLRDAINESGRPIDLALLTIALNICPTDSPIYNITMRR